MRRLLFALPLLALAALGLLFAGYALNNDPRVTPAALVGRPLPALSLPALSDGAAQPLREPGAGPMLVNVFASWCGPCEIEHPQLTRLAAEGLPITGVAYKDDPAGSRAFLARLGDPFRRVLVDRDGAAGLELGVAAVPETFLVGPNGVVLDKVSGPLTPATAARLLATARRAASLTEREPPSPIG